MTREIDTFKEKVISLDAGAKHISKFTKKKKNRRILLRWSNRGLSGVKLPTIRIGGEILTSKEALNWFLNRSREAASQKRSQQTKRGLREVNARIEKQAKELGI